MGITIKVNLQQVAATTTEAQARGHVCYVDRPEAKGGADRGPMGGELMLMGIGGCFMSNLLAGVAARELVIDDLTVVVSADLETSPPRFADIRLEVASAFPDKGLLQELVAAADANCISIGTARSATDVTVSLG